MSILEEKSNSSDKNLGATLPSFTIDDMAKAGVHFGHKTGARNPKARHYIYGEKHKTHLIDLRKSFYGLQKALEVIYDNAKKGKRIVFVSTIEKFEDEVKNVAKKSGQYYICKWKGGILTNWRTTVTSIKTLQKYQRILETAENEEENDQHKYTKKELVSIRKKMERLQKSFGGISEMNGMPDLIIVLNIQNEKLAITETRCIGIPVIGIVDTNSDPTLVDYPIAGNDDSIRVIKFYCDLFTEAILNGTRDFLSKTGVKSQLVIDTETNTIKGKGSNKTISAVKKKASREVSPEKVDSK